MRAVNVESKKDYQKYVEECAGDIVEEFGKLNHDDFVDSMYQYCNSDRMVVMNSNKVKVLQYSSKNLDSAIDLDGWRLLNKWDLIKTIALNLFFQDVKEKIKDLRSED